MSRPPLPPFRESMHYPQVSLSVNFSTWYVCYYSWRLFLNFKRFQLIINKLTVKFSFSFVLDNIVNSLLKCEHRYSFAVTDCTEELILKSIQLPIRQTYKILCILYNSRKNIPYIKIRKMSLKSIKHWRWRHHRKTPPQIYPIWCFKSSLAQYVHVR